MEEKGRKPGITQSHSSFQLNVFFIFHISVQAVDHLRHIHENNEK